MIFEHLTKSITIYRRNLLDMDILLDSNLTSFIQNVLQSLSLHRSGSRRTTVSEKYNRYASREITVFTVSGNGVMAIGYITSVFLTEVSTGTCPSSVG